MTGSTLDANDLEELTDMDDLDQVPIARPDDPSRQLHWRWLRAAYLAAPRRRPRAGDDPETIAAAAYLRRRRGGRRRPACPDETLVVIDAAVALARQNGRPRWEVEARILAGQDDDEIAARTGLTPDVARWYEALLSHVRDRLAARDWGTFRAVGTEICVACRDLGPVLRAVGYFGGPAALEVMLGATAEMPARGGTVTRTPAPAEGSHESARLLASLLMLPPTTDLADVLKLRDQLRRVDSFGPVRSVADAVAEEGERLLHEAMPGPADVASGEAPEQVVA